MSSSHPRGPAAVRRIREVLDAEGLRGVWFRALGELGYRRLRVLDRALDEAAFEGRPPRTEEGGRRAEVDPTGDEYRQLRSDADPAHAGARLASGARCYGVWTGGRLGAVLWERRGGGPADYLGADLALEEDALYLFDLYTRPELRRRGLGAELVRSALARARAGGAARAVVLVLPENVGGWAVWRGLGFRTAGWVGCVGFGARGLPFGSGLRRRAI